MSNTDTTPATQRPAGLPETLRALRATSFYPPADAGVPPLGATKSVAEADVVLYVHYRLGGCEWWIAEYDPTTGHAFGYACLGDPDNAEWGSLSLVELEAIDVGMVADRDPDWTPTPAGAANLPGWRTGF